MSTLKELLVKFFGSNNLYEVLAIHKDATDKQIKKAYHMMSLKVHPDRVKEDEKLIATEKFKVLGKIHEILSNKDKRKIYDETGTYDDEDDLGERNWEQYWRMFFKEITEQDIVDFEKNYKGSELEKSDLKRAYTEGKGCITHIMNAVPFAQTEEEPRLLGLLHEMIKENIIPEYDIFVNEPEAKRKRRHKRAAKEAKEAENLNKMLEIERESLTVAIKKRQEDRNSSFLDLISKLENDAKNSSKKRKSTNTPAKRTAKKQKK